MINPKVVIDFITTNKSEEKINKITFNKESNNISSFVGGNYNENISKTSRGSNPFILGSSKLGEGQTFVNSYQGYMSRYMSASDNSSTLSFEITGENIINLTIIFNEITNEYATKIRVNNIIYENYSTTFIIRFPAIQKKIYVDILEWNLPNKNIKISSINLNLKSEYTRSNGLISFTRGNQIIDDNSKPIYGLIGQYGRVEINDKNNVIQQLAEQNLLYTNKDVKIYLGNKMIGAYITSSFNKENDSNKITIELESGITKMQDINVPKTIFRKGTSLKSIWKYLVQIAINNGFEFENITRFGIIAQGGIFDIMEHITYDYPYIDEDNLFNQFNKICDLLKLRMYQNEDNLLVFKVYE